LGASNLNAGLAENIGISIVLHIIVFVVVFFLSSKTPVQKTFYAPVYKVDLVTLEEPEPKKEKKTAAAVVKKRPEVKIKRKKKTSPISSKKVKTAKKKPPKKAKKIKADPKGQLSDVDIRKKMDEIRSRLRSKLEKEAAATVSSKEGVTKVSVQDMDKALKDYYDLLWDKIRRAWILPGTGNFDDLESIISIIISESGELLDVYIEEESGNGFYDHSAIRAIRKSTPFPPLPEGYEGGLEVGFRFTP